MGSLIYTKEGTGVASFKSAAKVPLTAATINFEPIQEGSGTPSPSNVRVISGRSGLNVVQCGKNLWDLGLMESSTNNITYQNGVITGTADNLATQSLGTTKLYNVKPWQHHATISFSMYTDGNQSTSGNGAQPFFKYLNPSVNKVVYTYPNSVNSYLKKSLSLYSYNSSKTPDWFAFSYYGKADNIWHIKDFQFELGDIVTEYEPYRGTTLPIDWSSTAGEVYRGYIDLISGVLTITHKKITLTGLGTEKYSPYKFKAKSSDTSRNEFYVGGQTVTTLNMNRNDANISEWICSHATVYTRHSFSNDLFGEMACLTYFYWNSSANDYVSETRLAWPLSSEINTVEKANAWLQEQYNNGTPVEYIYPLITPEVYQLTPLQLTTLIGQNNLFCQEDGITNISVLYPICDTSAIREAKKRVYNFMSSGNVLPPIYQRADWLETLGRQARIDTGVSGNDSTLHLQTVFMPVVLDANYHPLFGNAIDEQYTVWRVITQVTSSSAYSRTLVCNAGNAKQSNNMILYPCGNDSSVSMIGKKIELDMEYGQVTVTSDTYTMMETRQTDQTALSNSRNIAIGSNNPTGNAAGTSKWRIYYFKMYSQGILVRDYIPVIRKSDSKAGFYDLINHTFNPSIGTQEFTAGYDT